MSNQIKINSKLVKYLQNKGYRSDPIVDQLVTETNALGKISQMQIAKEQCQFLEIITKKMIEEIESSNDLTEQEKEINIIMSILSNSTPNCIVEAKAECKIDEIGNINGLNGNEFIEKYFHAIEISKIDLGRAVTNNKGIMNGIDSVLIATGNDFRAVEAAVHSYACKDGKYKGLSECSIDNNIFSIKLKLPIAIGTVGGITDLHPLVKLSHKILGLSLIHI